MSSKSRSRSSSSTRTITTKIENISIRDRISRSRSNSNSTTRSIRSSINLIDISGNSRKKDNARIKYAKQRDNECKSRVIIDIANDDDSDNSDHSDDEKKIATHVDLTGNDIFSGDTQANAIDVEQDNILPEVKEMEGIFCGFKLIVSEYVYIYHICTFIVNDDYKSMSSSDSRSASMFSSQSGYISGNNEGNETS